ncbi:MAG: ABC transporter ATP-binding protein [Treponema sp.]|jgi:putative ABC transport system ATP-binding protein|nr:ABC transporter ATP-binding protein [Treponema sp.]
MPSRKPIVVLENLTKSYPMGEVTVEALKGISIEFSEGDFISVAGPSGSGKTTMMNIVGLIDKPSGGSLTLGGKKTGALSRRELTRMRREFIGFVFQSFNLLPVLTVFENVELPLLIGGPGLSRTERKTRVEYFLEEVGLADRRNHRPPELSGGQQQRAAIARAMVTKPKLVIADEPTANLDSANGERILELMKKVNQEESTTFLFSTHDPDIWNMADHILFLRDGEVESERKASSLEGAPVPSGTAPLPKGKKQ